MKSVFITKLFHLTISEHLGVGEKIGDSLRITNDRVRVEELLYSKCRPMLGTLEVESLLDGSPVIYSEQKIPADITPPQFLALQLYQVQSFLTTVWAFRDNCINYELGFLLYWDLTKQGASSNLISHSNTTSRGERVTIALTRDELRRARTFHWKNMQVQAAFSPPTSQLTAKTPRFSRAVYFITAARGEADIAIKVAHYCTAFETLFSSSQTELAHQLSERISFYLFKSAKERLENYRKLKAAYALRSKVVHGSTFQDSKLAAAIDTAEYCDSVARMIFNKVFQEDGISLFEKNNEEFEEAILHLIFGNEVS